MIVQKTTPLLWIIDSAPFFLGLFSFEIAIRQMKLKQQTSRLEELVEIRSKDVLQRKLFYEALVQNNPIAVVTLDKDHRILSVNPAFQEPFGFHQDEIMGKNLDTLIANPARSDETTLITKQVLSGKGIHEFGSRKRKDSQLVDVEIFGEPIIVNGNLIGVLGLYRDITLEKQAKESLAVSEERFRRMFTDSPTALRMEDFSRVKAWGNEKSDEIRANFKEYLTSQPEEFIKLYSLIEIIDLNDASLQLFNAKSKEELQEKLYSILTKESLKEAIDIICTMLDGKTSLECEMVYKRLDGKKVYTITKLSIMPGYENLGTNSVFKYGYH